MYYNYNYHNTTLTICISVNDISDNGCWPREGPSYWISENDTAKSGTNYNPEYADEG